MKSIKEFIEKAVSQISTQDDLADFNRQLLKLVIERDLSAELISTPAVYRINTEEYPLESIYPELDNIQPVSSDSVQGASSQSNSLPNTYKGTPHYTFVASDQQLSHTSNC